MRTAGMNWLADFRLATILFVRITTLSPDYVSPGMFPAVPVADADNIHQSELSTSQRITHHSGIVAQTQTAFGAIRAELARFGGMLARFNVDDKGTILFAEIGRAHV